VIKQSTAVIVESDYPVFWVEAWCVATQKWIAVDPLATATVGKPHKLEPPISDPDNTMAYVIAFEEGIDPETPAISHLLMVYINRGSSEGRN
jgi:hypothetical protein